jgi:hypothetical protein
MHLSDAYYKSAESASEICDESETLSHSLPSEPTKTKRSKMVKIPMMDDIENDVTRRRCRRRRGDKPSGYPTKNFLANFKRAHLDLLYSMLGREFVMGFELIQRLESKNGISMSDYEALYKMPEFEECWIYLFERRILYRELMLSRSTIGAKEIHVRKIYVFERAFKTKCFKHIN